MGARVRSTNPDVPAERLSAEITQARFELMASSGRVTTVNAINALHRFQASLMTTTSSGEETMPERTVTDETIRELLSWTPTVAAVEQKRSMRILFLVSGTTMGLKSASLDCPHRTRAPG